jgi:hypothetical protein
MNVGMLWYDNDPTTALRTKVERAADYYKKKYGRLPTLCLVHPSMLSAPDRVTGKVAIRPHRSVLPGHLWIGEDGNPSP